MVRFKAPHLYDEGDRNLIDVKVQWDKNVSLENQLDKDGLMVYSATLAFKVHSYIFPPKDSSNIIHKIYNNFYTCPIDSFNPYTGQLNTETLVTFVTGGTGSPVDYSTLTTIPTSGPITGDFTPPSGWDAWVNRGWQEKEVP